MILFEQFKFNNIIRYFLMQISNIVRKNTYDCIIKYFILKTKHLKKIKAGKRTLL